MPTMRVVQVTRANGPLEIVEREMPEPSARHVRIKVEACGICHSDAVTKEGTWPGIVYPRVPGHEIAGIIDAVGSGISGWTAGQRVGVGWHGGHCGYCDSCRRGDFVTCQIAPLEVAAMSLILGRRSIMGWPSGSSIDSQDTLSFSTLTGIRAMTEVFPLERAAEGYEHMMSGKARFRAVITTGH